MTNVDSRFYAALAAAAHARPIAPVNAAASIATSQLALQKVSSLGAYRAYLGQARAWKAARGSAPTSLQREVQKHAAQALDDGRALATAVLRSTRELKAAGVLDRTLGATVAGLKASGPVQVGDLWSDVVNDPNARELLRGQGVTDDLFTSLDQGMRQLGGRISADGARLVGDLTLAGQSQVHRVVLKGTASGRPRSLDDLLKRGRFERAVDQFELTGAPPILSLPAAGLPYEAEVAEVVCDGTAAGLQFLAQHKRKLEDVGLDTNNGNATAIGILFEAAVVAFVAGALLGIGCDDTDRSTRCTIAKVLTALGWLALAIGLFGLGGDAAGLGLIALVAFIRDILPVFGVKPPEVSEGGEPDS